MEKCQTSARVFGNSLATYPTATEYEPKTRTFFGYVSIFGDWNDEWGYFSLDELQSYKGRFGLGIERDLCFQEKRASAVFKK